MKDLNQSEVEKQATLLLAGAALILQPCFVHSFYRFQSPALFVFPVDYLAPER